MIKYLVIGTVFHQGIYRHCPGSVDAIEHREKLLIYTEATETKFSEYKSSPTKHNFGLRPPAPPTISR